MIQAASGSLFYLENYLDERAQESLMLRSYFTCYIFQSRPIPLPFHEMNYFVALQFHQMNRVFLVLVLFAVSCGSQTENQKDEAEPVPVYYPFSPRMDVDFEKGNKEYANTVLNIWRGYQSGNISGFVKYFADSLGLYLSDQLLQGKREDVLKIYQDKRARLAILQAHVEYWQPVLVKNKNEHWVLLWINQEGTDKNKKLDSWSMHQVWKFNEEGKIYSVQEFKSVWYY